MTVGHELDKITGLKLFHNHMTIELVAPFFDYGTKTARELVTLFREEMFKAVAKSDLEGLIFTYLWDLNDPKEQEYIDHICEIFESKGGEVYFVELEASLEERLKRNRTSHRLEHKPTKRDMEKSEAYLKDGMKKLRTNSKPGEIERENYLKINNADLSAGEVAKRLKEGFGL